MRFELDESAVRDLLMGESLYGDASLALRELYQNAVDACRHLDARRRYLHRAVPAPAERRIRFLDGVDVDGAMFVECADTGVGMGLPELKQAFSRAGVRSTDRVAFCDELRDYERAEPPVPLWTNSRFGIGVLSYFMIASRVEIVTTTFLRDGSLGTPRLGDRVPLRDDGDCRRWSAPRAGGRRGQPAIVQDPLRPRPPARRRRFGLRVVGRRMGTGARGRALGRVLLLWIGDQSDGLWAESFSYGSVINLTGEHMPQLTVDRKRILAFDEDAWRALAAAAIPTALGPAWFFVGSPLWLDAVFPFNPPLIDSLVDGASSAGLAIRQRTGAMDVATTGHLVGDCSGGAGVVDGTVAWWATRCLAAGAFAQLDIDTSEWPAVLPARPTDSVFLNTVSRTVWGTTWHFTSPWAADAIAVYDTERHLRWPIARIVGRARELGLPLPDAAAALPETTEFLRTLLEQNTFWLIEQPRRFAAFAIVRAAEASGLTLEQADDQLRNRHIAVDDAWALLVDAPPTPHERVAASQWGNGGEPWLSVKNRVEFAHLEAAARATGTPVDTVAAGLRRLGFSVDSDLRPERPEFDPAPFPDTDSPDADSPRCRQPRHRQPRCRPPRPRPPRPRPPRPRPSRPRPTREAPRAERRRPRSRRPLAAHPPRRAAGGDRSNPFDVLACRCTDQSARRA
ncbi:wHTH domain-containing protein [Subtercola boreus]|uniref:wHTH domain-containing protein n=1 Tax=Subtercola boreus TaxID=120213 RepID=UPI0011C06F15|nr:hypothetical protein [Subtercola boreus]